MQHSYKLVGVLVLGLTAACGSDADLSAGSTGADGVAPAANVDGTVDSVGDTEEPLVQAETLHQFSVQGTQITFVAFEDEVMMGYQRSVLLPSVTAQPVDGETSLTNLERFLAFQPDGVPHDKLVQDHLTTTQLQGRPDASVHAATLVTEIQEKTLLDDCKYVIAPWLATGPNPFIKTKNLTANGSNLTAAQSSTGDKGNMSAGACNFSSGAANGETGRFDAKLGTGAWGSVSSFTMNINDVVGWNINGDNTNRRNLRVILTKTPTATIQSVSLSQTERYPGD